MRQLLPKSAQALLGRIAGSPALLAHSRGVTYTTGVLLQRNQGGGGGGWGGGGGGGQGHHQQGKQRGYGGGGDGDGGSGRGDRDSNFRDNSYRGGDNQQQQQQRYAQQQRHGGGSYRGYDGGRGPQRSQRNGRDGAPLRRQPEQFLEQNAQTLVEIRRQFKQARSEKERRVLMRDARRLIRNTRIDPSTQDEKSVTIIINSVATFHASLSEGVEQAIQWMRKNLNGLSPQNIALFANAIGVLQLPDGDAILVEEVGPVVQAVMQEMTPVEIVMVLQAFQRERVGAENAELQDTLLRQLAPSVPNMPVPQLSTLASVLSRHALKYRDEAAWRGMVDSVTDKALRDVNNMHSKEAITFLTSAAYVDMPQGRIVELLQRATATVGFHTTEQIGELFRAIASIKRLVPDPTEDLKQACTGLEVALIKRLERVAEFATVPHVASIWKYSAACERELPAAVQERLVDAAMSELAWTRQRFPQLARFAAAACTQKLPSTAVLAAAADYAVGKRLPRMGPDHKPIVSERVDERSVEEIAVARGRLYARLFAPLVSLRLHLETAMAANSGEVTESLRQGLPDALLSHVNETTPRQALLAVQHIALAPANCCVRNTANDDAIVAAVEKRMRTDLPAFTGRVTAAFIKHFIESVGEAPKAKNIVAMLKAVEKE